jgi:hypothetical protein
MKRPNFEAIAVQNTTGKWQAYVNPNGVLTVLGGPEDTATECQQAGDAAWRSITSATSWLSWGFMTRQDWH